MADKRALDSEVWDSLSTLARWVPRERLGRESGKRSYSDVIRWLIRENAEATRIVGHLMGEGNHAAQ